MNGINVNLLVMTGNGPEFLRLTVTHRVNPIGSASLYTITGAVDRKGRKIDPANVVAMNPAAVIDAQIAKALHGDYVKHQEVPKKKRIKVKS